MKSLEQKIIVRCKNCGWRIFDKVTMRRGVINNLIISSDKSSAIHSSQIHQVQINKK